MEGAAAGSCVGAAPVRRKGAATARRQISNAFEGAAPLKFDKKFQISMGAAKEIWQNKSNFKEFYIKIWL